jgi:hypothetical protein
MIVSSLILIVGEKLQTKLFSQNPCMTCMRTLFVTIMVWIKAELFIIEIPIVHL